MSDIDPDGWEKNSAWWQEGYTDGVDPEYEEQMIPIAMELLAGYQSVLDVGCGEGQIARRLVANGSSTVVGVDPTSNQIIAARQRAGGPEYARAQAESLPVASSSFDAVIACLVFEHIADHVPAIGEIARVLRLGGRFVLFLNHPLLQCPGSGWIVDHVLEEEYWRIGPYLTVDVSMEELAPGVALPFVHRPMSHYLNALIGNGLDIVEMEEPPPPAGFLNKADEYADAASIPRLLVLVAERRR